MDPLSAVGLAGNIIQFIQFIDFAGKLVSGAVSLCNGPKAETLEMEALTEDIQRLAAKTRPDLDLHEISKEDEVLQQLGNHCTEVSGRLLSLLQSLKVTAKGQVLESVCRAMRSELKREEVEALQCRLDRITHQLNTHLMSQQYNDLVQRLSSLAQNERLGINRTGEIEQLGLEMKHIFQRFKKPTKALEESAGREEAA